MESNSEKNNDSNNDKRSKSPRQERQNVRKFSKRSRPLKNRDSAKQQVAEKTNTKRRRNNDERANNDENPKRPLRQSRTPKYAKKKTNEIQENTRDRQPKSEVATSKRRVANRQDKTTKNRKTPRKEAEVAKNEENLNLSIRLNQYVANSGLCSRREADKIIAQGLISINGKAVTEMGVKVKQGDIVKYKNKLLKREKPVYVLLNKPKDFITTTKDPQGRKTVMDLVKEACEERIYPVGRLDRNTTGLLLFTNDGDLAKKLSHPSHRVQKIYKVTLDKPITEEHLEIIRAGLELEDGFVKADGIAQLSPDGLEVGIELHVGRNRIVRRIFARLGYEVMKLDRTVYAGFTKENIGRAQWRYLSEREVIKIKFFTSRK
ncbi:MAG: rRNA pseudouridine synthase [Bernardetiaceae bacterium]|nr:rRNA pseudouridine synthase [Bernardetiaceae bacterium]